MTKTDKPWGYEQLVFSTEAEIKDSYVPLAVKKLAIDAEEMTSYHLHKKINEVLYVNKGMIEIRLEDDVVNLEEGQAYFIEENARHQIQNISSNVVEIIELSFPFDPDDIKRIEDPYKKER